MPETLIIDDLQKAITNISATHCDFLSENCIVLLENNGHQSGCSLPVNDNIAGTYHLQWKKIINKNSYKETIKLVEHAAEAISFFLSTKLTAYTVLEEALTGTGFDYWLGYDEHHQLYNPLNFMKARLEISGIERETAVNSLEKRVKQKRLQVSKSDCMQLPAYIAVIEFSSPKAYFGVK